MSPDNNPIRREDELEKRLDNQYDPNLRAAEQNGSSSRDNDELASMEAGLKKDDPGFHGAMTKLSEQVGSSHQNNWSKPGGGGEKTEWFKSLLNNPRAVAGNLLKIAIKNKSPGALLLAIVAFFGFFSLAGPAMAPFSLLRNVHLDLDDLTSAMTIRSEKLMLKKVMPGKERARAINGCTKLSLRCKFATIGDKQLANLRANGVDVIGEEKFGKRVAPTAYRFRGVNYSPEEWTKALNTRNHPARLAQLKANNMRYRSFADKSFAHMVLRRFNLSKKPAELEGTMEERVNKLLHRTDRTAADMKGAKLEDVGDDKNRLIDAEGKPITDADGNDIIYTDEQAEKIRGVIDNMGEVPDGTPTPRSIPRGMVGAFSALGAIDTACTIRDMIGVAAMVAKIANAAALASWAFELSSNIDKMAASDSDEKTAAAVGKTITDVDTRKDIPATTNNPDGTKTVPNPNYMKSAMDSSLVLMSIVGGVAEPNDTDKMFSLGTGQNSMLKAAGVSLTWANRVLTPGACKFVQNPITRAGGIIVAIGGAIGSGGGSLAVQGALVAGQIAAILILNYIITSALESSPLAAFENRDETVGIGSALWSGLSVIQSSNAQGHGLTPGRKESILRYQNAREETNQDYIALERSEAHPLDMTNPYSLVGSIAHSFTKTFGYSSPLSLSTLVSAIPSSVRTITNDNVSAKIETDLDTRYSRCDDESYREIDLAGDIQCNVRFVLSVIDIDRDLDDVVNWMEDPNACGKSVGGAQLPCVEEDTTTGLPPGYQPPHTGETQQGIINALKNMAKEATLGQFFAAKNYDNVTDYEAWLDFCIFRTMPFGNTYNKFGDTALIGQADEGWLNGSYCMLEDKSEMGEKVSMFRTYWQYKSAEEAGNMESTPEGGLAATGATPGGETNGSGGGAAGGGAVSSSGWTWPTTDPKMVPGPCYGGPRVHAGLDININTPNAPVYAMKEGTVIAAGSGGAAGNYVQVKTSDNLYYTMQHLSSISVKVGQQVTVNQQLGIGGKTGNVQAYSPVHLHITTSRSSTIPSYGRLGDSFDPMTVLPKPAPHGYTCYNG